MKILLLSVFALSAAMLASPGWRPFPNPHVIEAALPAPSGATVLNPLNRNFAAGLDNWTITGAAQAASAPSFPSVPSNGDYALGGITCTGTAGTSGQASAKLPGNASVESEPFTVPSEPSRMRFLMATQGSGSSPSITVRFSDDGYVGATTLFFKSNLGDSTFATICDMTAFAGRKAKVRLSSSAGGTIWYLDGGTNSSTASFRFEDVNRPGKSGGSKP